MEKDEKQMVNDVVACFRSFTCNELNKKLVWDVLEVLQKEAPSHGDRAILKFDELWRRMSRICN